jgi:hypothetical protein
MVELFQDYCIATSYGERRFWTRPSMQSFVTLELTRKVSSWVIPSLRQSFLPLASSSLIMYRVVGDNETLVRNIAWLAPVSTIAISSIVAYTAYMNVTSSIVKGFICAAHSFVTSTLSDLPVSEPLITLEASLRGWILNPDRFVRFGEGLLGRIKERANTIAMIAFCILDVGCMWTLQNPILATAISTPAAVIVQLIAMRCFAEAEFFRAYLRERA